MAKSHLWLDAFDTTKEFAVRVPMKFSGREFGPGDPFDKTLVTTRRLKQLYEQRKIVTVDHKAKLAAA